MWLKTQWKNIWSLGLCVETSFHLGVWELIQIHSTAPVCLKWEKNKTLTTESACLARSRLNGQGSATQEKHFSSTLIAVFPNKCSSVPYEMLWKQEGWTTVCFPYGCTSTPAFFEVFSPKLWFREKCLGRIIDIEIFHLVWIWTCGLDTDEMKGKVQIFQKRKEKY